MFKKLLGLVLVAGLVIGLLSGCGGSTKGSGGHHDNNHYTRLARIPNTINPQLEASTHRFNFESIAYAEATPSKFNAFAYTIIEYNKWVDNQANIWVPMLINIMQDKPDTFTPSEGDYRETIHFTWTNATGGYDVHAIGHSTEINNIEFMSNNDQTKWQLILEMGNEHWLICYSNSTGTSHIFARLYVNMSNVKYAAEIYKDSSNEYVRMQTNNSSSNEPDEQVSFDDVFTGTFKMTGNNETYGQLNDTDSTDLTGYFNIKEGYAGKDKPDSSYPDSLPNQSLWDNSEFKSMWNF